RKRLGGRSGGTVVRPRLRSAGPGVRRREKERGFLRGEEVRECLVERELVVLFGEALLERRADLQLDATVVADEHVLASTEHVDDRGDRLGPHLVGEARAEARV